MQGMAVPDVSAAVRPVFCQSKVLSPDADIYNSNGKGAGDNEKRQRRRTVC